MEVKVPINIPDDQLLDAGKIPFSLIEGVKRYSKKELNQVMNEHRVCMR